MRIGIFILCFNVEWCIRKTLCSIPKAVYDRVDIILLIDNHSDDRTVAVARSTITDAGLSKVSLVENDRNYGYGGSHKIAFDLMGKAGMDYAILFHGDGQGDPEALHQLVRYCQLDCYDFVIGSRFLELDRLDERYPLLRRVANRFFVCLQSWISGVSLTDPGSGQLAYRLSILKSVPYHRFTDQFHFTPQLLLYCSRMAVSYKEFPLRWSRVTVSSVNIWRHGWSMLRMLLVYRFKGIEGMRWERQPRGDERAVKMHGGDSLKTP